MASDLFGSDLWAPALDKYTKVTGLSVELFGVDGRLVLASTQHTPLVALFREFGVDPGLFGECAQRCLKQTLTRPAVFVDEQHGLAVVGTSLSLEGAIVGAAVAGYALVGFSQVTAVQRWARSVGLPFDRLWAIVRRQAPVPERRLKLHGELLQVLGDALLRENYRTRQLQAASAAKDEFMAVLSHELRSPLAPIAGWATVLRHAKNLAHVQKAAEVIERNAMLQSRLIDDLLDMNRIAYGTVRLELETLELQAVLRAALETVADDIETRSLQLDVEMPGASVFVEGDAGRLQQVFRNILSNAAKFTPSGGRVGISLSREEGHAIVVIRDTGKGIESEFLPLVFDMFQQQEHGTRREHQGLGIGMALVKRLTELHGGTVRVASEGTGQGTEVTVRLALAPATPTTESGAPPPRLATPTTLAGLDILVVEDAEDARESLRLILQGLGASVRIARDGREALDVVRNEVPDLVLCDLRMPNMDGFEFLRKMREVEGAASSDHSPVLAVSALASEADRKRTREAGFTGHLKKPVDMTALLASIDGALAAQDRSGSPSDVR